MTMLTSALVVTVRLLVSVAGVVTSVEVALPVLGMLVAAWLADTL